MRALPSRLLVVTDRHLAVRPLVAQIHNLVEAGARWIWLRDKDLGADERLQLARDIQAALGGQGTLTMGGDVALAAALGTKAVHLAQAPDVAPARLRLGADALIGVSAHSLLDVAEAARHGADYVTLSPIYATPSKPGYGPTLGLSVLPQAKDLGIPVLALGGITPARAAETLEAGAAGLAIMGGLMGAQDVAETWHAYEATITGPSLNSN